MNLNFATLRVLYSYSALVSPFQQRVLGAGEFTEVYIDASLSAAAVVVVMELGVDRLAQVDGRRYAVAELIPKCQSGTNTVQ